MITKGTWINSGGVIKAVQDEYRTPTRVAIVGTPNKQAKTDTANANLIAEAGTVYNETGLTPKQLAEQRKDLLKACKTAMEIVANSYDYEPKEKYCECDCQSVNILQAAIKKAESEA